jgi:hypothetical protein
MSAIVAASVSPPLKSSWSAVVAQQKAEKAAERARLAAEQAEKVRDQAREQMLNRGLTRQSITPGRTSTKGFAAKDPALALAALNCLDFENDMVEQAYPQLNIVASKYCVRVIAEKLAKPTDLPANPLEKHIYGSPRSAAMMATKTVRFVFEVACELAVADPDKYAEARRMLEWHDAQKMLKGRETRGVGVVVYGDAAKRLLHDALVKARERVHHKAAVDRQYQNAMSATAGVVTGVADA